MYYIETQNAKIPSYGGCWHGLAQGECKREYMYMQIYNFENMVTNISMNL